MRVSIAMATYNGARFIGAQLASFAAQTLMPDELVITDDGSSDDTLAIVEAFAATVPFAVEVHRNPERLGYARNFEKALSLCSGDIIFLSDQDDVWNANKLAVVERRFAEEPAAQVIINDAMLADCDLRSIGHTQRQNIANAADADRMFSHGCCSAHRNSWRSFALPLPLGMAHDYWINGLAIELGCGRQIKDVLQYYRRHGETSTQWVLSDPAGVSVMRALRISGLRDGRPGWRKRIEFLHAVLLRLAECQALAAAHSWDRKVPDLKREVRDLEVRIRVCSLPRGRRSFKVLRQWAAGGYDRAAGWKSALKDLIRP